jgi:hypothetical protein
VIDEASGAGWRARNAMPMVFEPAREDGVLRYLVRTD